MTTVIIESEEDFKHRIRLNMGELEELFFEHPAIVAEYGELAAKAERAYNLAHETARETLFGIMNDARKSPTDYGIVSARSAPPEGAIESTARSEQSVIDARRAEVEAQSIWNITKGRMQALHHRKKIIESLVNLTHMGFFAAPKDAPGARLTPTKEKSQAINESVDAAIRRSRNLPHPLEGTHE